jgi:hypothetical protein
MGPSGRSGAWSPRPADATVDSVVTAADANGEELTFKYEKAAASEKAEKAPQDSGDKTLS